MNGPNAIPAEVRESKPIRGLQQGWAMTALNTTRVHNMAKRKIIPPPANGTIRRYTCGINFKILRRLLLKLLQDFQKL